MNTYTLSGGKMPLESLNTLKAKVKKVAQCLAHASLFGQNLTITGSLDPTKKFVQSEISFDLDYSLSPILGQNLDAVAMQTVYDSACQATREYIDRPYPRTGNMVCFAVLGDDTGFRKDVNNFIKIPFGVVNVLTGVDEVAVKPTQLDFIIAKVNSGLSDFYKPLEGYTEYMEIIDAESTVNEQYKQELQQLANVSNVGTVRAEIANHARLAPAVMSDVLQVMK